MNWVLLGIIAFIALQLGIGYWVSRRLRSSEDYFLAGRSLGLGLASFSIFATWFGAETCLSASGRIYENGFAGGSADPFGYALCLLLMALVFAVPLWKQQIVTLPDFFRARYSPAVEKIAVLLLAPTSLLWAAAQLRAFGQVLDTSLGIGVIECTLIAAAVVVIYTTMGGLGADVINDSVQGIIIIVCLVIVFVTVLGSLDGGPASAFRQIDPARWNPISTGGKSIWAFLETWAVPICGSVVAQELVARVLAAKSPQVARRAGLMGAGLYLIIGLIPATLGLLGPVLLPDLKDPEQFLPTLMKQQLSPLLYVLFTGAILCAILSTVDSTLLAAAAVVSHNIIVPLRPALRDDAKLRISRICVVCGGVIACVLALSAESIYKLVSSASAFGGGGLFVLLLLGMFTRLGGARSGLAALIVSMAVWAWGNYIGQWESPFVASLAVAMLVFVVLGVRERVSPAPTTSAR